jgi:uncharacterized protein YbjT (DUF2867 family)
MYAITGITGQVGGAVARRLLEAGLPVRAVLRDKGKADVWRARGCDIAIADMDDAAALARAFQGVEGVFVLLPPHFDPSPGFPEARAMIIALQTALLSARPEKVVCLSTIGAQAAQPNLLNQLGMMEDALGALPGSVAFLRAAWFMENALWDVVSARDEGLITSFLNPLDRPVPMVATADIGALAAQLLQDTWEGKRIVELEGPRRVSPNDIAAAFSAVLGRAVRAEALPRDKWGAMFRTQGMSDPTPRIQMLDGFNEGWIEFEDGGARSLKGATTLQTVIGELTRRAAS